MNDWIESPHTASMKATTSMEGENEWIEASKLVAVLGLGAIEAALFMLVFGACGDDNMGSMNGPDATMDSSVTVDGSLTDAAQDASNIPDVCIGVDCGNGTCIDTFGEAVCRCDGNWVGESCDACAIGYALPGCDTCAINYKKDDSGVCVENPCGGVTCGDRGECVVLVTGLTMCECRPGATGANCQHCDTGYTGDDCTECDTGYAMDNGLCVPEVCVGNRCGDHGTCVDNDGAAVCECEEGYQGRICSACATGYVDDGSGTCIPDVCEGVECNHGECIEVGGSGVCECPDHFADASCTTCETGYTLHARAGTCELTLPEVASASVIAWYDAAAASTMTFGDPGKIYTWKNKLGTTGSLIAYASKARPDYVLFDQAVRMNGTTNYFYSYVNHAGTANYVIYMVLKWDAKKPQWLFRTHHNLDDDPNDLSKGHGLTVRMLADGKLQAEHRHDFGSSPGDIVEAGFFETGKKQLVKIARQPLLNGTAFLLSNGSQSATIPANEPPFNHIALATVGCNHSDFGGELFDGDLHEIITIHGDLSAADSKAIEDYLKVKWGL